jgi:hypothetical protein
VWRGRAPQGSPGSAAQRLTEYERVRDESVAYDGTERLGMMAHEMRNLIHGALLSFSILQEGTVGIGGSTGAVLGRKLRGLRDLVNNALVGVRLDAGVGLRHRSTPLRLMASPRPRSRRRRHGRGGHVPGRRAALHEATLNRAITCGMTIAGTAPPCVQGGALAEKAPRRT